MRNKSQRFICVKRELETAGARSRITAQTAESRPRKRKKKDRIETEEAKDGDNSEELSIKGHSDDAKTIQQAHKLLIDCGISLRATEKVFELFNSSSKITPSFTGIRKWFARIGFYELTREKQYRDDWILIVDFTLELGKQKALVVLGVSQEYLREKVISQQRGLSHEDVELLG